MFRFIPSFSHLITLQGCVSTFCLSSSSSYCLWSSSLSLLFSINMSLSDSEWAWDTHDRWDYKFFGRISCDCNLSRLIFFGCGYDVICLMTFQGCYTRCLDLSKQEIQKLGRCFHNIYGQRKLLLSQTKALANHSRVYSYNITKEKIGTSFSSVIRFCIIILSDTQFSHVQTSSIREWYQVGKRKETN